MSSKCELIFKDNLLFIKLNQKLDLDGVRQLILDISENYDYRFRLWDLSSFSEDFSLSELSNYATIGDQVLTEPGAIALYCESDLLYGEMRQYVAIRSQNPNVILEVFRDYDKAVTWLSAQRDLALDQL